jgi:hypothetical protein
VDAAMYYGKSTFFFFKGKLFSTFICWAVTWSLLSCQQETVTVVRIMLCHAVLISLWSTSMHCKPCLTLQNHSRRICMW